MTKPASTQKQPRKQHTPEFRSEALADYGYIERIKQKLNGLTSTDYQTQAQRVA